MKNVALDLIEVEFSEGKWTASAFDQHDAFGSRSLDGLIKKIKEYVDPKMDHACIIIRRREDRERVKQALKKAGIKWIESANIELDLSSLEG